MNHKAGTLYVVSTPIGNLNDISHRAIEILKKVDICAAEDTRKSIKLFNTHNISTKLISYHKFSEKSKATNLINKLIDGENIAIISDAGTPMISDPGGYLVNQAIKSDINIVPIPGASSVTAALSVSGFNIDIFKFFGFLSRKKKEREAVIKEISTLGVTSVVFESGKRIRKLLTEISEYLPTEIEIFIAREMTKIHETFYRGTVAEVIQNLDSTPFGSKGEFVLIISGFEKHTCKDFSEEDQRIMDILLDSMSKKEALSLGSKILNKKRNFLYQKIIEGK